MYLVVFDVHENHGVDDGFPSVKDISHSDAVVYNCDDDFCYISLLSVKFLEYAVGFRIAIQECEGSLCEECLISSQVAALGEVRSTFLPRLDFAFKFEERDSVWE
jgi:hypothetical protein